MLKYIYKKNKITTTIHKQRITGSRAADSKSDYNLMPLGPMNLRGSLGGPSNGPSGLKTLYFPPNLVLKGENFQAKGFFSAQGQGNRIPGAARVDARAIQRNCNTIDN